MAKAVKTEEQAPTQEAEQTAPAQPQEAAPHGVTDDGIIARKSAPRKLIPADNHLARCCRMIMVGTVDEDFQGKKKHLEKVRIQWELPDIIISKEGEEDKVATIEVEYTLSMDSKANLRRDINGWRGLALTEKEANAFDITVLLGKCCLLNVIHQNGKGDNSEKVYEKVASVAALPKVGGKPMPVPEAVNKPRFFNYGKNFDNVFLEALPDFIKTKMKGSDEYKWLVQAGKIPKELPVAGKPDYSPEAVAGIAKEDLPF